MRVLQLTIQNGWLDKISKEIQQPFWTYQDVFSEVDGIKRGEYCDTTITKEWYAQNTLQLYYFGLELDMEANRTNSNQM